MHACVLSSLLSFLVYCSGLDWDAVWGLVYVLHSKVSSRTNVFNLFKNMLVAFSDKKHNEWNVLRALECINDSLVQTPFQLSAALLFTVTNPDSSTQSGIMAVNLWVKSTHLYVEWSLSAVLGAIYPWDTEFLFDSNCVDRMLTKNIPRIRNKIYRYQ